MPPFLQIQGVSKRYEAHQALNQVSFDVPKGSIFGLLGPNGAGKTSLIRIITQITGPDEGQVLFEGQPLQPDHVKQIGYLPEERGLYKKMKVGEQLLYLARLRGLTKEEATVKIKAWADRLDLKTWLNKNVEDLSKGMQQKVQFISCVLHEPKLLILDEPFSGFDPVNANIIKDEILKLREQGCTIIFSTHRMESVEQLCDDIVLINRSQIVLSGSVKEVRARFRAQTYHVEGLGKLLITSPDFKVLQQTQQGNEFKAEIQLENNTGPNDLLRYLIERVEVHLLQEKVPSIHDIFVQTVTQPTHG
ncbi:ABC transporter ATP-binding protein [Rufibacter quisquiliarum]|uniref:ABC-2 type transport system ATP-binding protein n=1 Tax=Rufibacter quisquiliarum TaxID=1549639 RepID=A0A839GT83_9BACT|nr:ATP-binding cassette domain-containing protein [Rufibacter quisquiliarum]MBA9077001.1 ABC-2 type transport system ATP-binding protein [Rufibacter quisquiliarum]